MRRFLQNILAVLLAVLPPLFLAGSPGVRNVHNFGVSAGLANGYVRAIGQDSEGYVWIATNDGLSRFDGHGFINFNKDNSGLSANELNGIAVCSADPGKLWIATQRNGLCFYDCATGQIGRVGSELLRSPDITSIVPAADGGLWLTHYHYGVQYYNPKTGESHSYDFSNIPGMPIHTWIMGEGEDGMLYVGHIDGGLSVIDTATHGLKRYVHSPEDPTSIPGDNVYSICVDSDGTVWLGTDGGAALLNPRTGAVTRFVHDGNDPSSIAPGRVWCIRRIGDDEIWFGTSQGGVSILDTKSYKYADISRAKFRALSADGMPEGLTSPYIYSIFRDTFGNIWLGNYRAGVDL